LPQVREQALQVLAVGQNRDPRRIEEVRVPVRETFQAHRQIALDGSVRKCSMAWKAANIARNCCGPMATIVR
jgi:hypothetical protein